MYPYPVSLFTRMIETLISWGSSLHKSHESERTQGRHDLEPLLYMCAGNGREIQSSDVSFGVPQNNLLTWRSSCRWLETPWRSWCDVSVKINNQIHNSTYMYNILNVIHDVKTTMCFWVFIFASYSLLQPIVRFVYVLLREVRPHIKLGGKIGRHR